MVQFPIMRPKNKASISKNTMVLLLIAITAISPTAPALDHDSDLIRATLLPGLLWSFLNGNAILAAHMAEVVILEPTAATHTPIWRTALNAFQASPLNPEKLSMPQNKLTNAERQLLEDFGWTKQVASAPAIWVDVTRQILTVIKNGEIQSQMICATAEAGTGARENSNQTPLGWHHVAQKIGDDAPWGQVFRARIATNERWKPGDDTTEDLVLTRLIWLSGNEPGKNQGRNATGQNVDSKSRYIYIHGTNDEARIGTPSSHGCIRLTNDDAITLFENTPLDTPVLITAQPLASRQEHGSSK